MNLKDKKYDGKGGLWKQHHPQIAAQGNIQIGGRIIALTMWHNNKGGTAPEFTLTLNAQKTTPEDMAWFKSLSPTSTSPSLEVQPDRQLVNAIAAEARAVFLASIDDDIPF